MENVTHYTFINNICLTMDDDTISLLIRFSKEMSKYDIFIRITSCYDKYELPFLITDFDKRFYRFICTKIIYSYDLRDYYNIDIYDVVREINCVIQYIITEGYSSFQNIKPIDFMLSNYPITLLSNICNSRNINTYILTESLKTFIKTQGNKRLPDKLSLVSSSIIPLVGHVHSPLDESELNALFEYLGTKKKSYVHILLNILYELSEQEKYLYEYMLCEDDLLQIIKSSWFYILTQTPNKIISKNY